MPPIALLPSRHKLCTSHPTLARQLPMRHAHRTHITTSTRMPIVRPTRVTQPKPRQRTPATAPPPSRTRSTHGSICCGAPHPVSWQPLAAPMCHARRACPTGGRDMRHNLMRPTPPTTLTPETALRSRALGERAREIFTAHNVTAISGDGPLRLSRVPLRSSTRSSRPTTGGRALPRPPPLGGGAVSARPPREPPREGKAPTTTSCSPTFYPGERALCGQFQTTACKPVISPLLPFPPVYPRLRCGSTISCPAHDVSTSSA
jgi:hypothetical protein